MSVYKFGGCNDWEAENFVIGELEEFYQFLEEDYENDVNWQTP